MYKNNDKIYVFIVNYHPPLQKKCMFTPIIGAKNKAKLKISRAREKNRELDFFKFKK